MKNNKHLFIFSLLVCFLCVNKVSAASCDYDTQINLSKEAANIKLSYEEAGSYLNIKVESLPNTLYMVYEEDRDNKIEIRGNGQDQLYLWTKTDEPHSLKFEVYSSNYTTCPDNMITVKTIDLPMYNRYSTKVECNDHKDLYVCNTFTNTPIDDASFQNAFNKMSTIDADEEITVNEEKKDNSIITFIKENKVIIIAFSCLIVFGIVMGIILNKRKNRMF